MSLTHWDWFLNVLYVFMSVFSWISIRCYQVWVTGVLVVWILEPLGYEIDVLRRLAALRVLRLGRLARAVRIMPMFHESPGNWRWRWIQHQKISHTQLQNTSICMRITYDNHVRMLHLPSELQRPEGKWCQIEKFAKRMSPWWLLNVFQKLAILTSLVALPILTIFLRQRDLGENPCNEALDACEWSSWMYTTSFLVLCASTASTFNRIVEYHFFWVCHSSRHSLGDHWSGAFYVCRGGHGDHHKIWTFWRWRSCTKTLWIVILLNVHTFSVHDLWQLGILCKAGRKKILDSILSWSKMN